MVTETILVDLFYAISVKYKDKSSRLQKKVDSHVSLHFDSFEDKKLIKNFQNKFMPHTILITTMDVKHE